jgi:hypothetical protein
MNTTPAVIRAVLLIGLGFVSSRVSVRAADILRYTIHVRPDFLEKQLAVTVDVDVRAS